MLLFQKVLDHLASGLFYQFYRRDERHEEDCPATLKRDHRNSLRKAANGVAAWIMYPRDEGPG